MNPDPKSYNQSYVEIEHVINLDSLKPKEKQYTTSKYARGISWCCYFEKVPTIEIVTANNVDQIENQNDVTDLVTRYHLSAIIEANINESNLSDLKVKATFILMVLTEDGCASWGLEGRKCIYFIIIFL